jgi:pyruvate,orthophosphate dikinase
MAKQAKKSARKVKTSRKAPAKKASVAKAGKYVYNFGSKTDGNGTMKPLLGGKGANLAEMCRIGLPVPPGFTITTEVCTYYYDNKRTYPSALKSQMQSGIAALEHQTGKKFGDLKNPLLVSVRSGARDSMPGMMTRFSTSASTARRSRRWQPRLATRDSPGIATAGSSRCTATSCSVCRSARVKITIRSRP